MINKKYKYVNKKNRKETKKRKTNIEVSSV
jgi:translation initiation factor IF-3